MGELNPITHEEQQLAAILEGKEPLKPILHEDLFYAALAKGEVPTEKPITRKEMYLKAIAENGLGGGGTPINNQDKTITENGTYTADEGYTGLGTVTVDVAASGGGDSEQVLIDIIEDNTTAGPLPSVLTKIRPQGFYNNMNLALTSLPEGITDIGDSAFFNCQKLALTSLPKGLTIIKSSAFYGCTILALTSLPEGITRVSDYAFYNCRGITELTFNSTPSYIASSAFGYCFSLLTINVPWAEGEVTNAPWGATNAEIRYNYVAES